MSIIYTVRRGDCLYRIAAQHGFADWRTIYNHPENAAFRARRPNPNVIFPGDEVAIPDRNGRTASIATGERHRFVVNRLRVMLRLGIHDEAGQPITGKRFELKLGSDTFLGVTSGEGIVEQRVPETGDTGELTVWLTDDNDGPHYFWNLKVGHLDPVDEDDGLRQRLNNLGFYCGDGADHADERLRMAIRGFQDVAGITKSGEADAVTRSRVVEMHGGV